MRWGRGLFRLWVVVSVLWLIVGGAFAVVDWRNYGVPVEPELCKELERPERVADCGKIRRVVGGRGPQTGHDRRRDCALAPQRRRLRVARHSPVVCTSDVQLRAPRAIS
jgi:hypothetical protein